MTKQNISIETLREQIIAAVDNSPIIDYYDIEVSPLREGYILKSFEVIFLQDRIVNYVWEELQPYIRQTDNLYYCLYAQDNKIYIHYYSYITP